MLVLKGVKSWSLARVCQLHKKYRSYIEESGGEGVNIEVVYSGRMVTRDLIYQCAE